MFLTLANMGFGFLVIWIALTRQESFFVDPSRFLTIIALILMVSSFFDFLDGFVARKLKATSTLGIELDSLADLISFGVAPVVIFYVCFFDSKPTIFSFVASLAYLLAGAFRLARFNETARNAVGDSQNFVGLPITGASLLWIGFLLFVALGISDEFLAGHETAFRRIAVFLFASLAALMVSRLPYKSFKAPLKKPAHFKRNLFLLGLTLTLLAIRLGPETLLIAIPILYVFGTPFIAAAKKVKQKISGMSAS